MAPLNQATVSQSHNAPVDDGSIGGDVTSPPLKPDADSLARRLLERLNAAPDDHSQPGVMAIANRPNSSDHHTGHRRRLPQVEDLFPPEKPIPRMATLHPLQEWEGYVVEVGSDEFVARLVDLTAGFSHATEEATIPFAEISERDAATLDVGAIFRWVIGYERSPEGTRKRVSLIVFRDLPRMTDSDFQEGEKWAAEVAQLFNP